MTNHVGFFLVGSFSETECEIAYCLSDRFDLDRFVVGKVVVLAHIVSFKKDAFRHDKERRGMRMKWNADLSGNTSVFDHSPRIGGESGHGTSNMSIDFHNFLNRI